MSGTGRAPSRALAPSNADVAIVAALPIELAPLIDRLAHVRKYSNERRTIVEGTIANKIVVLAAAGPGQVRAEALAKVLLAGHRPQWLIAAGFAGSLVPGLGRNATVLPGRLVNSAGAAIEVSVSVNANTGDPGSFRAGSLVTVDHIVRTAKEKAKLHTSTGADLVDMESFAVARLCGERGVRFLCVRVISDDAKTDLPPELLTLVGPTGGYRIGAAVGALMRNPARLGTMLRLRDHAEQAADRLAKALLEVIATL
jgi:adenosylhomocysteine nucleosidase